MTKRKHKRRFLLVGALVLLAAAATSYAVYPNFLQKMTNGCPSVLGGEAFSRSQLGPPVTFGAVTEFSLPQPQRTPNAIAVMPDGSVWFGEEAVPGLGHLYPNGVLVEYRFPDTYGVSSVSGTTCAHKTDIWSITAWNGSIWATDSTKARIVGLNPLTSSFRTVNLSQNGSSSAPYTMIVGPGNGSLWFTQVSTGQVGVLYSNGTLLEHAVEERSVQLPAYVKNASVAAINLPGAPAEIVFVNEHLGYGVDASPLAKNASVFEFNPDKFFPEPVPGAGSYILHSPDSIALGDGGIWIAQHGASSVGYYDLANETWTIYPTSKVSYVESTLPYFVRVNGSSTWFNEHFGNRIAVLDFNANTLTEYSISDPPAGNLSQIRNALTFALGPGKVWFTELTANGVGYVDASRTLLAFSVSVVAQDLKVLHLRVGGTSTIQVRVSGSSTLPLEVELSGQQQSASSNSGEGLSMNASNGQIGRVTGQRDINATISAGEKTLPGRYIEVITVSDGLVSRSVYLEVMIHA